MLKKQGDALLSERLRIAPLSEKHSLLSSDEEQIKRKIDYFEDKINSIVYGLYDLTEGEIKIVEGK